MSKEILLLAEALASEKNVSNEIVFEALEVALGIAAKKKADREQMDLEIRIDRETGDYKTIRKWLIVEDLDYTYPELEKTIEQIQEEQPEIQISVGDYYEEELPNEAFGRQAAQTAKQIILQRIRDAEREQILNHFLETHENIVTGTVKRMERHGIVVELAPKLDALIPREQMLPRENYRGGDRIRALFCARIVCAGSARNRRRSAGNQRSGARPRATRQNRRVGARPAHRPARHVHRRARFARERRVQRDWRRAH